MAFRHFETNNANYILQLGSHDRSFDTSYFHDADALVIENGRNSILELPLTPSPQIRTAIDYCVNGRISYFTVDVNPYNTKEEDLFLSKDEERFQEYFNSDLELPDEISMLLSDYHYERQRDAVEMRNAINAEKTETFVAPEMRRRLKRKPVLGLVYGFGHVGIEPDIKEEKRRARMLEILKAHDYEGFHKEVVFYSNEWRPGFGFTQHVPGLFDRK